VPNRLTSFGNGLAVPPSSWEEPGKTSMASRPDLKILADPAENPGAVLMSYLIWRKAIRSQIVKLGRNSS
jgi:hypothetical protein